MGGEPLRVLEPRRRDPAGFVRRLVRLTWRFRRATLLAGFLLFACLLFPRESSFEVMTLREGYPAKRDLIAPFQFYLLKDRDLLRQEQTVAARRIAPVFSVDESVETRVRTSLDSLRVQTESASLMPRAVDRIRALGLSRDAVRAFDGPEGRRIATVALRIADRVYEAGLLSEREAARAETDSPVAGVERNGVRVATPWSLLYDRAAVRDLAWTEGQAAFPTRPEAAQALQELATASFQPSLRYEASTTEALRAQAREGVNQYEGVVQKDEKIIGSHELATRDHIRKLESLRAWSARVQGASNFRAQMPGLLGRAALIAFLLFGFLGYLRVHHRPVYEDTSMLLLIGILTAAVLGVGWAIVNRIGGYEMLIPTTVLSLTVAVLFGQELAFVGTLVVSLLVAVVYGLGLPFLTGSALAGIAAIATASGVRRRRDFYLPMLIVAIAYAFAIGAMGLVDGARWDTLIRRMAWGVVAGFGSVLLVTLLLPLLELLFSVTTDITLLELADLNRPILRRLMLEAPGTYHHSLVVGSLSEAGAEAVGGNPLLSRVAAYYHDIGKIDKAEYYVENQSSARSRHEKLSPTMSCLIIEAHVREGAEIARREKLPKAILNGILEHHGTTLMSFFYHKAHQADSNVEERDFRYPGPKPRSKETAVLMLADAVEAASRSLTEPTPSRIRGVVTRILDARVEDGQLDESPITFEDLAKIREGFIPILTALFHARVHYPGAPTSEDKRRVADEERGRSAPGRGRAQDERRVHGEKSRLKIDHS
ncbi:MAG TPA: HDIG domain-containing protein [Candidatus Binatia bacterium]|nr:HDIG domain-containing protein [Candidatus Binatia bacterium]